MVTIFIFDANHQYNLFPLDLVTYLIITNIVVADYVTMLLQALSCEAQKDI